MTKTYLVVGHGGQGVLDLGNFIAYSAMLRGLHVAYTPSYGPETRGGKVRCYVVTSPTEIDSPIVDEPDVLVAMNNPSMDFETSLKPDGLLLVNSSLVDRPPTRGDVRVANVPATGLADDLKHEVTDIPDTRVLQNSVAYGALLCLEEEAFDPESTKTALGHVYTGSKARFVNANLRAVEKGHEYVWKTTSRLKQADN